MSTKEEQLYTWVEAAYRNYKFWDQIYKVGLICEDSNVYFDLLNDCYSEHIFRLLIEVTIPLVQDDQTESVYDLMYNKFYKAITDPELLILEDTFAEVEKTFPSFRLTEFKCPEGFINQIIKTLSNYVLKKIQSNDETDDWDF